MQHQTTVTLFMPTVEVGGKMQFRRKVLHHTRLEQIRAGTSATGGPRRGDYFHLYIFENDGYVEPDRFGVLSPDRAWTLPLGGYVAEGDVLCLPDNAMRINSVLRADTPKGFHHWEVSGRGRLYER